MIPTPTLTPTPTPNRTPCDQVGLQEIYNVLHGVLLELRELKAAQRGDN